MKKIFVNITSWTRVGSVGAEHFYAKVTTFESDKNIYDLAREWFNCEITDYEEVQLQKPLTSEGSQYLNKKCGFGSIYKKGDMDDRFDSIEEIMEYTKKQYPQTDIAFFNDHELLSEDRDVYEANPKPIKKTDRKIQIHNITGFSNEFVNLTEGSIHEIIETPEKYKNKKLQAGVWVWGITEPVLVLMREFEYIN